MKKNIRGIIEKEIKVQILGESYDEMVYNFLDEAEELTDKLKNLINRLPYNGDTCETSQKVCLVNQLNELIKNFSGIRREDFFTS